MASKERKDRATSMDIDLKISKRRNLDMLYVIYKAGKVIL